MDNVFKIGVRLSPVPSADGKPVFPRSGSLAIFRDAGGHEVGRCSFWELSGGVLRVRGQIAPGATECDLLYASLFGFRNIPIAA